ncbi:MAG: DUF4215 domain-containing protein [Myxococcales bacterium]|nr:DUF4215 domain-containing protein [Myxococcales bacterium]
MHKAVSTGLFIVPLLLAACSDDAPPSTETGSSSTSTGDGTSTTAPTSTEPPTSSSSSTTDESTSSSTTDPTTGPPPPVCGDGNVDAEDGEECDDGAANADDAACTSECKSAICGDGLVLAGGEECDDGNADDSDACVSGCLMATCGDTFVWAGMEGCDDGNDVDDDACSNACVMASCGDGVVQMGESCDDMNADDTDDCTSLCQTAACGDGFVQAGVEECDDMNADDSDACVAGCKTAICGDGFTQTGVEGCDDMNADETDTCTTLCQPPACDDALLSGSESDIDCGGADCMKCTDGQVCNVPSDCMSGACLANVCAPPQTCKDLLAGNPMLQNGMYNLDLDGPNGPLPAGDVYCDMKTNGGGWTIFYAATGVDNEQPLVSNVEVLGGNPLMFKHYNINRDKKIALSANSTETLFLRTNAWLKVNSPAFDATLNMPMKSAKKAVMITENGGISGAGFMGWSNFNNNGGGDFGLTQSPDMITCGNNMQMTGFDHQDNRWYMLNCQCKFHYLYSYSATLDGDAGYDVGIPFGMWEPTGQAACNSAEGGSLVFYAAMR